MKTQITEVKASVTRLIAGPTKVLKKYENVTITAECKASVVGPNGSVSGGDAQQTFDDCLWFCQKQILNEMDRMERGIPPKGYVDEDAFPQDEIPDFQATK